MCLLRYACLADWRTVDELGRWVKSVRYQAIWKDGGLMWTEHGDESYQVAGAWSKLFVRSRLHRDERRRTVHRIALHCVSITRNRGRLDKEISESDQIRSGIFLLTSFQGEGCFIRGSIMSTSTKPHSSTHTGGVRRSSSRFRISR